MTKELSIYLDLLRILAAFAVLFGHASGFTGGVFWQVGGYPGEAVAVFFVLSGYFISYVISSGKENAEQYVVARMARIYSVALPAIAITLVFDAIGSRSRPDLYFGNPYFNDNTGLYEILRYVTFTNEIRSAHIIVGTNEPYWSLGFEVWYYAIFGLWCFAPSTATKLGILALGLLVIGPQISIYFPLWLMGVAAHRLTARPDSGEVTRNFLGIAAFLSTFLLLAALVYFRMSMAQRGVSLGSIIYPPNPVLQWPKLTYFYGLGFCTALHVVGAKYVLRIRGLQDMIHFVEKPIRWVAGGTFALYLFHQPILICMSAIIPGEYGSRSWGGAVIGATLGLVYLFAELSERRKSFWRKTIVSIWNLICGRAAAAH